MKTRKFTYILGPYFGERSRSAEALEEQRYALRNPFCFSRVGLFASKELALMQCCAFVCLIYRVIPTGQADFLCMVLTRPVAAAQCAWPFCLLTLSGSGRILLPKHFVLGLLRLHEKFLGRVQSIPLGGPTTDRSKRRNDEVPSDLK